MRAFTGGVLVQITNSDRDALTIALHTERQLHWLSQQIDQHRHDIEMLERLRKTVNAAHVINMTSIEARGLGGAYITNLDAEQLVRRP